MECLVDGLEGLSYVASDYELRTIETSEDILLVKFVKNKICPNGDSFSGQVNAITGELISGKRMCVATQECYDGEFLHGERHGSGVCTKLNGEGKFIGIFMHGWYHSGTLVTNEHTYVGLFKEGIFNGQGTLIYSDGTIYDGNFDGGVFSGLGKLINPEGDQYEGSFRDGMKHGHGKIVYGDGSVYVGDWNKDCKDGVGRHTYACGREYDGEFVDNKRHGKGTMTTSSATVAGPWRDDRPLDGPGWTIQYPKSGVQYRGDAVSCRPHGDGEFSFRHQDSNDVVRYEGQVLCGLRHGTGRIGMSASDKPVAWKGDLEVSSDCGEDSSGIFSHELEECDRSLVPLLDELNSSESDTSEATATCSEKADPDQGDEDGEIKVYSNGDTFRGHIDVFGKRQGFGIFSRASTGMCFSGQWKSSKKHGRGTLSQPLSGVHYSGNFIEGVIEGHGSLRCPDGSTFTGIFLDGMMHGKGTFHDTTSNSVYVGDFSHSLKHGEGEEEYPDGSIYCGPFVKGKRSGKVGSLYHNVAGGRLLIYQGNWIDDAITGHGERYELSTPCQGSHVGQFKDGKRHGYGTFTSKDGTTYEGNWLDDVACDGDWVITCPKGSVYYGAALCNHGIPTADGFGTRSEGSTFYSGGFRLGQPHGSGLCVFSSGEQWDGRWEDGVYVKYGRTRP